MAAPLPMVGSSTKPHRDRPRKPGWRRRRRQMEMAASEIALSPLTVEALEYVDSNEIAADQSVEEIIDELHEALDELLDDGPEALQDETLEEWLEPFIHDVQIQSVAPLLIDSQDVQSDQSQSSSDEIDAIVSVVVEPDQSESIPVTPPMEEWREASIVARWNEAALQAIRADKPVPTVITRSLHLAHAAMYDAWAAYQSEAEGAYFNPRRPLRQPKRRHAEHVLERAVSAAAHGTLIELFPSHRDSFDQLLGELGFAGRPTGAIRVGQRVARTVLNRRADDGSNADNGYEDRSGYQPMNDPESEALDPNYWTPLKVPTGLVVDADGVPVVTDDPASYQIQKPLTPHWGEVHPFAIEAGNVYRPEAPPKLGDFTTYVDAEEFESTNDAAYRQQFSEVAELSAGLTTEQKVIAEYWADGPSSSTPPGHWNEFAQDISLRERYGLEEDVKFFFMLNNALFDTGIAIWDAKYAHDFVRPQTAIRFLFADQEIEAWGGPNQGTQLIPGSEWRPYQDVTFVTPAFPEYTSGHSGFSFAAATVLEAFTGSDVLYDGISRGAQDFDGDGQQDLIGLWSTDQLAFEDYQGDPITLQWNTVWDAAEQAGHSRLYGGIHIQDGDLRGRAMGHHVAIDVIEHTEALFHSGHGFERVPTWNRRSDDQREFSGLADLNDVHHSDIPPTTVVI